MWFHAQLAQKILNGMVYDIGEPRDLKKLVNLGCHVICFRDLTSCFFLMRCSNSNMLRNLSTSKLVKVCNLKAIKYLPTYIAHFMYRILDTKKTSHFQFSVPGL